MTGATRAPDALCLDSLHGRPVWPGAGHQPRRRIRFASLDQATLALLRTAMLPPFPTAMVAERVTITAAVRYTLQ